MGDRLFDVHVNAVSTRERRVTRVETANVSSPRGIGQNGMTNPTSAQAAQSRGHESSYSTLPLLSMTRNIPAR